jgi:hypothetical protein
VATELSDNERALLAREVAADRFEIGEDSVELQCEECGCRDTYCNLIAPSVARDAAKHGWDAALEYVRQCRQELLPKP